MPKIIISSKNPVKITAALNGFKLCFPKEDFLIEGISVSSGVSDQPMTEKETMKGALNRLINASKKVTDADYWVAIEGGIQEYGKEMVTFAWVYIKSGNLIGKGRSASFILPQKITELIKDGKELGDADDIVFGKSNSKQQNGASGILTKDVVTRTTLYIPAVVLALIPFRNKTLY